MADFERKGMELDWMEKYLLGLYGKEPGAAWVHSRDQAVKLGKARISLGPVEGRILGVLVRMHGAKKFVEFGTLTGTSALWILWGMQTGKLWTLEKESEHCKLAEKVLSESPFKNAWKILEGDAEKSMLDLRGEGPFDGCFIDANKTAYLNYLKWAEDNLRSGALLVADNVFLRGSVAGVQDVGMSEKQAEIMRQFNLRVFDKFEPVTLPTVEGMTVAIKK